MPDKGFDIESLLHFAAPRYLCEKCNGIFTTVFSNYQVKGAVCPICKVKYNPAKGYGNLNFGEYLDDSGHGLVFQNLIEHCKSYGMILNRL